tara:strand:- start:1 stop:402 length:402 start_codon:yes stop_codon:yes gene_type:complete
MNTRTLTESDYEILTDWWKAWGWPVIVRDMLPDNGTGGVMIEHEGENVVAGFLYWSNSKMVWLDWIISNPKTNRDIRQEAIKKLILTAESMTKEAGSKFMMSISRSNSLLKIHKELGWTIDPDPSHEMIKAII